MHMCILFHIYNVYTPLTAINGVFLTAFFGSNNYKLLRKGSVFLFTVGSMP
jgi:hypothetical protein